MLMPAPEDQSLSPPWLYLLPPAGEDLWIFAYGSLMWNPGFSAAAAAPALLKGYHRSFCILSHQYRGTPERPGLVLGLDRGGSCRGIVFRVAADQQTAALDYLWQREMAHNVYRVRRLPVRRLDGGCPAVARAVCFIADRCHDQYCGRLQDSEQVRRIRGAAGCGGPNIDYLANTVVQLRALGIIDESLEALYRAVTAETGL